MQSVDDVIRDGVITNPKRGAHIRKIVKNKELIG